MSDLRTAAHQMLEAIDSEHPDIQLRAAVALRAALAQQEQEPVAWMMINRYHPSLARSLHWTPQTDWHITWDAVPLYTHPPCREWQSLNEEEIQSIHDTYYKRMGPQEFARAIESKLKEKNNG